MVNLDVAIVTELRRLREVTEAQLVAQRETNRLLQAIAVGRQPEEVPPAPVERTSKQAKKDSKGLWGPRY